MKLLLVIYSGSQSQLVPELFDAHDAGGYTQLGQAHGAGATGKHTGTRAWPGGAAVFFSIVPADRLPALLDAIQTKTKELHAGERLHAAVLPTETFF